LAVARGERGMELDGSVPGFLEKEGKKGQKDREEIGRGRGKESVEGNVLPLCETK